jgi:hypothetical protein
MPFLYETHLHTSQGSSCGRSRGREYVQKYIDLGFTGIIVTDHFFNGNCAVDRNLPWKKWVEEYCRGYEDALEEGLRRGLDVFFGWEETFDGDDYLVYGLDKEWLLGHPEVTDWTRKQQYEEVGRCGGCVVQAHPFRQYHYINCVHLSGCVDAVEAANSGNERSFDALAWAYAGKLNVPVTAGSDIHHAERVEPGIVFGVYLDRRMKAIADYVTVIRNNAVKGLQIPAGRCDMLGDERLALPVDFRDRQDRSTGKSIEELINR